MSAFFLRIYPKWGVPFMQNTAGTETIAPRTETKKKAV